MAEWSKAAVLKTAVGVTLPWVRIPLHPLMGEMLMTEPLTTNLKAVKAPHSRRHRWFLFFGILFVIGVPAYIEFFLRRPIGVGPAGPPVDEIAFDRSGQNERYCCWESATALPVDWEQTVRATPSSRGCGAIQRTSLRIWKTNVCLKSCPILHRKI